MVVLMVRLSLVALVVKRFDESDNVEVVVLVFRFELSVAEPNSPAVSPQNPSLQKDIMLASLGRMACQNLE